MYNILNRENIGLQINTEKTEYEYMLIQRQMSHDQGNERQKSKDK